MDKRNQMENPFFDPDKPGSIFVGMDRYHQYSPHPVSYTHLTLPTN